MSTLLTYFKNGCSGQLPQYLKTTELHSWNPVPPFPSEIRSITASMYCIWKKPANIDAGMNLKTNLLHYQELKLLLSPGKDQFSLTRKGLSIKRYSLWSQNKRSCIVHVTGCTDFWELLLAVAIICVLQVSPEQKPAKGSICGQVNQTCHWITFRKRKYTT